MISSSECEKGPCPTSWSSAASKISSRSAVDTATPLFAAAESTILPATCAAPMEWTNRECSAPWNTRFMTAVCRIPLSRWNISVSMMDSRSR